MADLLDERLCPAILPPSDSGRDGESSSSGLIGLQDRAASKAPVAIDLFAGAGGFSLAALNAGFDVVSALELDRHAAATYARNIRRPDGTPVHLLVRDAMNIAPHDLLPGWIADPELDLIMGGPPCQGFSTHRIKNAGVDDSRNQLLIRYFHFVAALQPKMFLIENVPGLLWPRHEGYLEQLYRLAAQSGYRVLDHVTLNARDYGVPQSRRRVFILGTRNDFAAPLTWPPPKTHGAPGSTEVLRGELEPWLTAGVAFGPPPTSDPNSIHMNSSPAMIQRFLATPINGGSRSAVPNLTLPCHRSHNGHKDVYGRIDPSKPGPTMTTACINPSKGRFVHPTEPHGITVRQAARLQTFPDGFVFEGGLTAAGAQVGNAVPVQLGVILLGCLAGVLQPPASASPPSGSTARAASA